MRCCGSARLTSDVVCRIVEDELFGLLGRGRIDGDQFDAWPRQHSSPGPALMFCANPETRPRTDTAAESSLKQVAFPIVAPFRKLKCLATLFMTAAILTSTKGSLSFCPRWFMAQSPSTEQRFAVCLDVGDKRS